MVQSYDKLLTNEIKDTIINDYVNGFLSLRDLSKKYNIKSKTFLKKLIGDKIRNFSESSIVSHKKYSEKFKHTDETKNKIRQTRLKYLKEHPEDTAWRRSNMSYPEKCFINYILDRKLDKIHSIEREKSFFPYYVDFAFNDIQLAIEIDGSQHLQEERKKRDDKKDELLNNLGWKVIRISENVVKTNWELIDKIFLQQEYKVIVNNLKIGIYHEVKKYIKVERDEYGRSDKQNKNNLRMRKVIRPSKEELLLLIQKMPFTVIAEKYGVSSNAITKWCKYYKLPHRKKDIKLLLTNFNNKNLVI